MSIKSFTKLKAFYIKFSGIQRLQRIYKLREYCDGHLHQEHRMGTVLQNFGSLCFIKKVKYTFYVVSIPLFQPVQDCTVLRVLDVSKHPNIHSSNVQMTNTIYTFYTSVERNIFQLSFKTVLWRSDFFFFFSLTQEMTTSH